MNDNLSRVAFGNGRFVAGSPYLDYVLISEDGLTWTRKEGITAGALAFGGGEFLAHSRGTDRVWVSEDGMAWWEERLPRPVSLSAFAYGESSRRWVGVGSGGTILTARR
ncbi:MAG: hypothetical protein ACK4G4_11590 [Thermus sp.]|uniref:hypothetical protein n=1 Tax=Thermus sp. TaxID=275 RepID=UPI00391B3131